MAPPSPHLDVSSRSTPRRKRERATADRATIHAILDEALVCHVGFSDGESTYVLPTTFGRVGEVVYLHGALANHMCRTLLREMPACLCATLLDGIVFARSAVHHSMNYRSVVLFGSARLVDDVEEKRRALEAIVEHVAPGRSAEARPPSPEELRSTLVVAFPVTEGTAKIRSGGPIDDEEDLSSAVWAGHLPLALATGPAVPDGESPVPVPAYVSDLLEARRPPMP